MVTVFGGFCEIGILPSLGYFKGVHKGIGDASEERK